MPGSLLKMKADVQRTGNYSNLLCGHTLSRLLWGRLVYVVELFIAVMNISHISHTLGYLTMQC